MIFLKTKKINYKDKIKRSLSTINNHNYLQHGVGVGLVGIISE